MLTALRFTIPRRALALTLEWAALHREELMEAWELCRRIGRQSELHHWIDQRWPALVG
jgi:hypothetical protein